VANTDFPGLAQIGQINVRVHDLQRAVAFYRDILGIRYLFEVPRMAFFGCAGIRLLLSLPESKAFDHPSSILYSKVNDINESTGSLKARGVTITGEPELIAEMPDPDLWMSSFKDSEDNTLALMSEVRPPVRRQTPA